MATFFYSIFCAEHYSMGIGLAAVNIPPKC